MRNTIFLKSLLLVLCLSLLLVFVPATAAAQGVDNAEIRAEVDENNSLIVNIEGSTGKSGLIMVEYWSEGVGPFLTQPVATMGDEFSIQVMRLRAETTYQYRVLCLSLPLSLEVEYQGTFETGALPDGLQDAELELIDGNPTYELALLDFNDSDFNGMLAIDSDARIVWYYQHDKAVFAIAKKENHNLVFNEIADFRTGWTMYEMAPDGTVINSVDDKWPDGTIVRPHGRWHHEIFLRPDNKVWTLGSYIRPLIIDGTTHQVAGITIEEWDIDKGTVTRLVNFFDIMDAVEDRTEASTEKGGFFWRGAEDEYLGTAEDWIHTNSIDVAEDGKILVSHRHLNQVMALEPDFSEVAWRLGGPQSDFTFPDPSDQFWHQHTAQELPNGNILLFDNGNFRPEEQGGEYSRALELELDFDRMEARKVWEYRYEPDLYASCCSSVTRLPNGNTVLVFGRDDINDPQINTLIEADPDGNTVAATTILSPGKTIQYRAYPLDSINGER